jgi:endonuclease/exonuclease/phosphatase family metal-dependent hydrolase
LKRKLWGSDFKTVDELNLLKGVGYDHIVFNSPNTFHYNLPNDRSHGTVLQNFKSILDNFFIFSGKDPNADENSQIYKDIIKYNNTISDWKIRGYKISQKIKSINADIVFLEEYGSCHDKKFTNDLGNEQTLEESLSPEYVFLFFLNPKFKTRHSGEKDGIAIYFKPSIFRFTHSDPLDTIVYPISGNGIVIDTESVFPQYGLLKCIDIHKNLPLTELDNSVLPLVKINDRRSFGIVNLTHILTGKRIIFIIVHLMTDTKDADGRIKKEELKCVFDTLASLQDNKMIYDPLNDGLVFAGDFNTTKRACAHTHILHAGR